jgi:ABC-type spermidine/putrescine transport system permease subunit II
MQARRSGLIAVLIGAFVAIVPTFALYRAVSFLCIIPLVLGIICIGLGVLSLTSLASHWLGRNAAIIALVLMSVSFVVPFGLIYYDSLPRSEG